MPKAALHNLGCKVNAYETEAMEQQLKERGYEIVPLMRRRCLYYQYMFCYQYCGPQIRQMLHRAKKLNPEYCSGGSRLLCAGGIGRVEERCQRGYCNWKQ